MVYINKPFNIFITSSTSFFFVKFFSFFVFLVCFLVFLLFNKYHLSTWHKHTLNNNRPSQFEKMFYIPVYYFFIKSSSTNLFFQKSFSTLSFFFFENKCNTKISIILVFLFEWRALFFKRMVRFWKCLLALNFNWI